MPRFNLEVLIPFPKPLEWLWCSQHVLVALDDRACIIDGNSGFCKLLEYPRATLINQPLKTFCIPETSLAVDAESAPSVVDAIFDKRQQPRAFTLLPRMGKCVPVHVIETWLIKSNGLLVYVWVLAVNGNEHATRVTLEQNLDDIISAQTLKKT